MTGFCAFLVQDFFPAQSSKPQNPKTPKPHDEFILLLYKTLNLRLSNMSNRQRNATAKRKMGDYMMEKE